MNSDDEAVRAARIRNITSKTTPLLTECAFRAAAPLALGARVERYVVAGPPTCGGFAAVYRCLSERDGSPVAIKVLNESRHHAPRAVLRFEREIELIQRIRHPNIVKVFGAGSLPDGRPYYAMEWLDGSTLAYELSRRGPLLPAEALPVLAALGGALSAAHAANVVHRDIKPDNIIAVPQGPWFSAKLLDFGIAKLLERDDEEQGLTSVGRCLGSLHYMAPEQILGDRVDARTDIYAFGVLVYRTLTGVMPFQARDRTIVQMMHLDDPPPRASALAPAAAPWDEVIQACMAKAPSERPTTIEEVVATLRAALSSSTATSHPRERITCQIEAAVRSSAASSDPDEARAMALERVAEAAEEGGWTILIEADDAVIASRSLPSHGARAVARARDELVQHARRLAADCGDPDIALRVWIRPEGTPPPAPIPADTLRAGVYLDRTLATRGAPLPMVTHLIPGLPRFLFIPCQE